MWRRSNWIPIPLLEVHVFHWESIQMSLSFPLSMIVYYCQYSIQKQTIWKIKTLLSSSRCSNRSLHWWWYHEGVPLPLYMLLEWDVCKLPYSSMISSNDDPIKHDISERHGTYSKPLKFNGAWYWCTKVHRWQSFFKLKSGPSYYYTSRVVAISARSSAILCFQAKFLKWACCWILLLYMTFLLWKCMGAIYKAIDVGNKLRCVYITII